MKKLLTVTSIILLFACLTQGFSTPGNAPRPGSFHSKWQHTTWVNPWLHDIKASASRLQDYTIHIENYWQPNISIDYIAVGSPTNYTSGASFPVSPGESDGCYTTIAGTQNIYVGVTIVGPMENPDAGRVLFFADINGYHCLEVTGSGEYVFYNMSITGATTNSLYADTGGCD
jgi:hypothetical protein